MEEAEDEEIADLTHRAPTLSFSTNTTLDRRRSSAAAHTQLLATSGSSTTAATTPLHRQYTYTHKTNAAGERHLILSKDAMELQLKQMKSYNRQAYEARVRQGFLEEQVARSLYMQRLAAVRQQKLGRDRLKQEARVSRESALGTPYLQAKDAAARNRSLLDATRAQSAPQFSDMKFIEARLASASLQSRGVTAESRVAQPVTVKDLALRASGRLPPNSSLMNPRNQTTSPLPPRELLLPRVADEPRAGGALASGASAKAVLRLIPEMFDRKRTDDADAERRGEPRRSMLAVLREHLTLTTEDDGAAKATETALRFACTLHKDKPRVAIFQSMVGWGEDRTPWDATKAAACLLLMLWLQPPDDEATKVSKRFVEADVAAAMVDDTFALELRMSDVQLVVQHLRKKRLLNARGAAALVAEARKLQLPEDPSRSEPVVSVDAM